ncbi:potassium/sodium hyperpolarization-activated cyclic nucleotide-gated channel 2-like isoform X1 [Lates japonicus]|uniref:Potassium/sodium hyperpolarization-activated cyclic nucleotide-gated channel 2-like isoform X1 n=1 Tax=Lates japonicus TaxID=270547 RepID=A0AAD3NGJ3_LATJO|nr:potassium/sodium hyperpolarization-activated cyclic nucleotide-gated channel 2-like isoform X1 [Lates japonicus]
MDRNEVSPASAATMKKKAVGGSGCSHISAPKAVASKCTRSTSIHNCLDSGSPGAPSGKQAGVASNVVMDETDDGEEESKFQHPRLRRAGGERQWRRWRRRRRRRQYQDEELYARRGSRDLGFQEKLQQGALPYAHRGRSCRPTAHCCLQSYRDPDTLSGRCCPARRDQQSIWGGGVGISGRGRGFKRDSG